MRSRILHALAIAATLLILVGCWTPDRFIPGEHDTFDPWHKDKVIHGGMFALFAALWMLAAPSPRRWARVLAAGFGLAVVSEIGQSLPIVGRDAGLLDGLADAVGVIIGVAAGRLLTPVIVRAPGPRPEVISTGSPAP